MILIASSMIAVRRRWRQTLQGLFALHEVADLAALTAAIIRHKPAVLLLDLDLTGLQRTQGLAALRKLHPATHILVFSEILDEDEELYALKRGVRGYCAKTMEPALLVKAVELVQNGEIRVRRDLIPRLIAELGSLKASAGKPLIDKHDHHLDTLSPREQEIARLVAAGANNKHIAAQLSITERTVKAHLSAIFRKLDVPDRLKLALVVNRYRESA
jgi:DNA-binding NarL/FixJ family response regulator